MSAQPPRMIASSSGATRRPRGSVVVASRWAHAIRGGATAWARATPTCAPSAHVFVSPVRIHGVRGGRPIEQRAEPSRGHSRAGAF